MLIVQSPIDCWFLLFQQPLADWPHPLPMTQEQPTTLYDSMHKAQDTPLGSSTSSGETPPTSPHSRRTHTRRRSEDLSELSIAKERQMTVSPICLSPEKHRRKSAHASPDLHRRQLPSVGLAKSCTPSPVFFFSLSLIVCL